MYTVHQDPTSFTSLRYDYLVIGGGSAGSIVASRLAQDRNVTVGLLEAGPLGSDVEVIRTPGLFGRTTGSSWDWNFEVEAAGDQCPPCIWPRGKVLGGSGSTNYMVWNFPSAPELDAWEKLGNPGWNFATLAAHRKSAERYLESRTSEADWRRGGADDDDDDNVISSSSRDVGQAGPIRIGYPRYMSQMARQWVPTMKEAGFPFCDRPFSGCNIGATHHLSNARQQEGLSCRSDPAREYLSQSGPNLHILGDSLVIHLLWNGDKKERKEKKATGVTFTHMGRTYSAVAKGEVILAAGAIQSPIILERSGIGSKAHLERVGIECRLDLPGVGENLHDHTTCATVFERRPMGDDVTLDTLRHDADYFEQQRSLHQKGQPSILDTTVTAIAYLTLEQLAGSQSRANEMLHRLKDHLDRQPASGVRYGQYAQLDMLQKFPKEVAQLEMIAIDGYFGNRSPKNVQGKYLTILSANQHHFSRGSIHTRSADSKDPPKIEPRFFQVPYDLETSILGTELTRHIAASSPYRELIGAEELPGQATSTDQYVKSDTISQHHAMGTCSMMPRAMGGVVDPSLIVYGCLNVRVVDASIIPLSFSAHIHSTVVAVAERAAKIIAIERQPGNVSSHL